MTSRVSSEKCHSQPAIQVLDELTEVMGASVRLISFERRGQGRGGGAARRGTAPGLFTRGAGAFPRFCSFARRFLLDVAENLPARGIVVRLA